MYRPSRCGTPRFGGWAAIRRRSRPAPACTDLQAGSSWTRQRILMLSLSEQNVADLRARLARFAPVDLSADLSSLPANEREALRLLILASRVIDSLYLRQVWAGNEALLQALA